tara:strand:+ start:1639 stop:2427 length:789 start_codon:yes stop_codon:yes gene_type:complete
MLTKVLLYLRFLSCGTSKYNIHSPFVHSFIENVLDDRHLYYNFLPIEQLRKWLLAQDKQLFLNDFGAGSKYSSSKLTTISQLAKNVQSSKHKGQLLFKIVNYFQPKKILEFGTSLGLSSAYLASSNKSSKVYTIEGDKNIVTLAKNNFVKLRIKNIDIIEKNFDDAIEILSNKSFELVFFDGNHRKEPTLKYFEWAKKKITQNSIFIFDDIYWSKEMKDAWDIIRQDSKVSLSIDIFSIGIVFFIDKNQKEHFQLIHKSNFY